MHFADTALRRLEKRYKSIKEVFIPCWRNNNGLDTNKSKFKTFGRTKSELTL